LEGRGGSLAVAWHGLFPNPNAVSAFYGFHELVGIHGRPSNLKLSCLIRQFHSSQASSLNNALDNLLFG
jgi:hypothetical protein